MDIAEDVKGFDEWFGGLEGFSLRAERFDGDVAWLKAAYAAGVAFERERCAKITLDPEKTYGGNGVEWLAGSMHARQSIASAIRSGER